MIEEQRSEIRVKQRAINKSKLIGLILLVLVISSGSLYYINTPIFYYGALGFSVLAILLLVYIVMYFTQEPKDLFQTSEERTYDEESETIKNPGLENILKAEKRYERRKQIVDKPRVYRKGTKSEIKKKSTKKKPETDSKKSRIGSIPVEESIYKERIKLKSASSKQKDSGKEEKVTTFLCPSCGSKELYYEAGLISGYKYHCKDCDYIGSFVIEKDFKVNE